MRSKLKLGKTIIFNGKMINPSEVCDIMPGKKILYCTDTRPTKRTEELSKNADLLIHDGMFDENLREIAINGGHSTVIEAAQIAKKANVKKLILIHISSRYEKDLSILNNQAKKIFPNTIIAEDLTRIEV